MPKRFKIAFISSCVFSATLWGDHFAYVTKGENLSAGVAGRVGRVVLEPNPQVGKSFPWIRQQVRLATRGKYNNHPRDISREPGPR